jgi:hypothetical protein
MKLSCKFQENRRKKVAVGLNGLKVLFDIHQVLFMPNTNFGKKLNNS